MADRRKIKYRGRTYYVKSRRPGVKTVRVRAYCRRKRKTFAERYFPKTDTPF